jgi:hypothetical protein
MAACITSKANQHPSQADEADASMRQAVVSRGACYCKDGWICQVHPDKPWEHDGCTNPGILCVNPECVSGRVLRAKLEAQQPRGSKPRPPKAS